MGNYYSEETREAVLGVKNGTYKPYVFGCGKKQYPKRVSVSKKKDSITTVKDAVLIRKELIAKKGNRCQMCSFDSNPICFCFHHRDPKIKKFELGSNTGLRKHTIKEIYEEADKCDLLCRNCHATVHSKKYKQSNTNLII